MGQCSPCAEQEVKHNLEIQSSETVPDKDHGPPPAFEAYGMASEAESGFGDSRALHKKRASAAYEKDLGEHSSSLLNVIMQSLWSMIEDFSKTMIKDIIEPAVKKAVPRGSSFSFKLDRYSLGHDSIQMGQLSVYEAMQGNAGEREKNIVVETDVSWKGSILVPVAYAGITVEVCNVDFYGDVIVELNHMIPRPPLFNGGRVCFVNRPKVALTFSQDASVLSHVLNVMPGVRQVQEVVIAQLSQKFVVPNCLAVRLNPEADKLILSRPRAVGVLQLHILRAKNLLAMDMNGKSDPFVRVSLGATSAESQVKDNNLNPTFDWHVILPIHFESQQELLIEVFDKDTITSEFLGILRMPIRDLMQKRASLGDEAEIELDLEDKEGNPGKNGKLFFKTDYYPMFEHLQTKDNLAKTRAVVFVGIDQALHIPFGAMGTKYWVQIECTNRKDFGGGDSKTGLVTPKKELDQNDARSDKAAEVAKRLLRERVEVCRQHKMSDATIASVLGICEAALKDEEFDAACERRHVVTFNKAFEFLVDNSPEAVVTVTLKESAKKKGEQNMGDLRSLDSDNYDGEEEDSMNVADTTRPRGGLSGLRDRLTGSPNPAKQGPSADNAKKDNAKKPTGVVHSWQVPVKDFIGTSWESCKKELHDDDTGITVTMRLHVRWIERLPQVGRSISSLPP